jgi:AraC family transcriptional activator of pobA
MAYRTQFFNQLTRSENSAIHLHKHSVHEFVYYCTGSGRTTIGGTTYEYHPGDFSIIHAEVEHDEFRHTETKVIFLGFSLSDGSPLAPSGLYSDPGRIVRGHLQEMAKEMQDKRNLYLLKMDSLLQLALIEIDRMRRADVPPDNDEKLAQTVRYIHQYYSDQVNLTQLAKMANYSYDHFRHLFKQHTGETPMNYIIKLRIDKAKQMLLRRQASTTQVALECGFASLSHFSNAFKKLTGKSPREFALAGRS